MRYVLTENKNLVKEIVTPEILRKKSGYEKNFNDMDLEEVELKGDFTQSSFKNCNLKKAVLNGDFHLCDFSNADMREATLFMSCFTCARFENTNLERADLKDIVLGLTSFHGANLKHAMF